MAVLLPLHDHVLRHVLLGEVGDASALRLDGGFLEPLDLLGAVLLEVAGLLHRGLEELAVVGVRDALRGVPALAGPMLLLLPGVEGGEFALVPLLVLVHLQVGRCLLFGGLQALLQLLDEHLLGLAGEFQGAELRPESG